MKRYLNIFRIFMLQAVKVELAYRSQVVQRMLGIMVTLSVTTAFWLSVSKNAQGTYSPLAMVLYFVVVCFQDFLFVSGDEYAKKVGEQIRSGKLSTALVQPFPYLLKIIANGFGGIVFRIFLIVPFIPLVRLTILRDLALDHFFMNIGFYFLAFLLATVVTLLCLIATGLLAFDMTHVWAPWIVFVSCYCMLGGIFYPADLPVGWVKSVMNYTPFYYIQGFPALVMVGRLSVDEMLLGFARGCFVMTYMTALLAFMWRRGIKKFEAIGI